MDKKSYAKFLETIEMDVHLIDIDMEFPPSERVVSNRAFGYNRIDMAMLFLCFVMACVIIGFFIWFGVTHPK